MKASQTLVFFVPSTDTGRLVGTGIAQWAALCSTPPSPSPSIAVLERSSLYRVTVGTGTNGPMAARLAICRAQHQLSTEAGVKLHTRNFAIINQVGACSLNATLECDQFANAHPHDAHFDQQSFVGLAWRPARECICCEVYSTGRANLPGSTRERNLQESWARMLPELLRFSSRSRLLDLIPESLKRAHFTQSNGGRASVFTDSLQPKPPAAGLLDGWDGAGSDGDDFPDDHLAALGL